MPQNALTGRRYSGVNILILWDTVVQRGFGTQSWLTFRQALSLGGSVRKGERGTTVVYASRFIPCEAQSVETSRADTRASIPFLKRFTVFNADQCDGLLETLTTPVPPVPDDMVPPSIDALTKASGAVVRIGGDKAFYSVTHDYVQVPRPDAFLVPINFARTLAHELSHWVGAKSRLARSERPFRLEALFCGGMRRRAVDGLCLRLAWDRADRPSRRLPWQLARHHARGQPRHHPRSERRLKGRGLPAQLPRHGPRRG